MTGTTLLLIALVLYLAFVPLNAWMASGRRRSPTVWAAITLVSGPFATLVLTFAPPGRCPNCGADVIGWPEACAECGAGLDAADSPMVDLGEPHAAGAAPVAGVEATASALSSRSATAMAGGAAASAAVVPAATMVQEAPTTRRRRSSRTTVKDDVGDTVMLATAMFVTGSDLHPGMNYLLAIRNRSLVIFGPIETDPHLVAIQRPLRRLRVTAFSGDLLINDVRPGWSVGFAALHGGTPESVERAMLDAGSGPGVA